MDQCTVSTDLSKTCTHLPAGQDHLCLANASLTGVSVSLGRITQNWFPSGLARTAQDLGAAGQFEMPAFLTVFGSVTGIRHRPAAAFSRVPMTISPSRAQRTFQPGACVRNGASPGRS